MAELLKRTRPRFKDERINLAHGAGGKASAALVDAVFIDKFRNEQLEPLEDGAIITVDSGERLAFATDSFVVTPSVFPGGSIGHLAVHGTINDLATMGAIPQYISAAFVLEEGLDVALLKQVVADMSDAATRANVRIVTGDTKVVGKGGADGLYITTSGVGAVPSGRDLSAKRVQVGDKVIVSGNVGDHGMAVMLARGDVVLDADIRSDTAAITGGVETLLSAAPQTRWLRDPTRGGVGTVCNELAQATDLCVVLEESTLPVQPAVNGACDLLGIDPLYVACEGRFIAVVPADQTSAALSALQSWEGGRDAAVIGEIAQDPQGLVLLQTALGGARVVDMLVGDPLPRIC